MKIAANGTRCIEALRQAEQRLALARRSILLSASDRPAGARRRGSAEDRPRRLGVEPWRRAVDQLDDESASAGPAPGGLDHGAVEPAARREDARRVDEHDLGFAPRWRRRARGKRVVCTLWVTIETFCADQAVDQGRLAGIRCADDGGKAAPADRLRRVGHFQIISRLSKACRGLLLGAALGRPAAGRRLIALEIAPESRRTARDRGRYAPARHRSGPAGRAPWPIPAGPSWDPCRRPMAGRYAAPRR